jgi:hypothetical protein
MSSFIRSLFIRTLVVGTYYESRSGNLFRIDRVSMNTTAYGSRIGCKGIPILDPNTYSWRLDGRFLATSSSTQGSSDYDLIKALPKTFREEESLTQSLDQISDEDLLQEVKRRGLTFA